MRDPADSGSLFIGLMSGTSLDGIDAALVSFGDHQCTVVATRESAYPDELRAELLAAVRTPAACTVDKIGQLDRWVGECFRDAALALLEQEKLKPDAISAIGSHGQTLRHQPRALRPFTLQIGDPNVIAAGTRITTVADFRRRDIAHGGEGAPLAPAFHQWLFADPDSHRAVLNIGGIANVTMLLPASPDVVGFDTGPGNTLLDAWMRQNRDQRFDEDGAVAAGGKVSEPLLAIMMRDPYFELEPPKTTGFEYFNALWIRQQLASLGDDKLAVADVQATLAELTAQTIAMAILRYAPTLEQLLVCGGGTHNADLMRRLESYLTGTDVWTSDHFGLHPDWVEAAAFAWLARQALLGAPGNLPSVTGAHTADVLGGIYMCAS